MTVILTALLFTIGTEINGTAMQSPPVPPPPPPPAQMTVPAPPPSPPAAPTAPSPVSVKPPVAPPMPAPPPPPPPPAAQGATPPQPPQPPPPPPPPPQGWLVNGSADSRLTMTVRANGEVTHVVSWRRPSDSVSLVFDQAKQAFERGNYEDAEVLTNRALQLIRAASQHMPAPPPPPAPTAADASGTVRHYTFTQWTREYPGLRTKTVVNPVYPPAAIAANIEGDVEIEVTIAGDGAVKNARVLTGSAMLQEAALKAVRQWTFVPIVENGKPVERVATITIKFVK